MKKLITTAFVLCMTAGGFLFAQYPAPNCPTDDECCSPLISRALLGLNLLSGWQFSADWLHWTSTRSNLHWAGTGALVPAGPFTGGQVNGILMLDPEWDDGYRLQLSTALECTCWDIAARYTHFETTASDSATSPNPGDTDPATILTLTRLVTPANANLWTVAEIANADYTFDFDVVDILGTYAFCWDCPRMTIAPFIGVKLAFITEKVTSKAFDNGGANQIAFADQKNDIEAYGLTTGFTGVWSFWCDRFEFFSRTGIGLLYGCTDRTWRSGSTEAGPAASTLMSSNLDITTDDLIANLEISLGFSWRVWCTECLSADVSIGYDFQNWWVPEFLNVDNGNDFTPTGGEEAAFFSYFPVFGTATIGLHGVFLRGTLCF